jgi:hypothetical protein
MTKERGDYAAPTAVAATVRLFHLPDAGLARWAERTDLTAAPRAGL